jgi:hypothetical protein
MDTKEALVQILDDLPAGNAWAVMDIIMTLDERFGFNMLEQAVFMGFGDTESHFMVQSEPKCPKAFSRQVQLPSGQRWAWGIQVRSFEMGTHMIEAFFLDGDDEYNAFKNRAGIMKGQPNAHQGISCGHECNDSSHMPRRHPSSNRTRPGTKAKRKATKAGRRNNRKVAK